MQLLNPKLKCKYSSLGKLFHYINPRSWELKSPKVNSHLWLRPCAFARKGWLWSKAAETKCCPKSLTSITAQQHCWKLAWASTALIQLLEKQLLDYLSDQFQNDLFSKSEHRQTEEKSSQSQMAAANHRQNHLLFSKTHVRH